MGNDGGQIIKYSGSTQFFFLEHFIFLKNRPREMQKSRLLDVKKGIWQFDNSAGFTSMENQKSK